MLVSVNYRTGFEGWAHIAGAPANRGLLDQSAALRWVQDNIAVFGGDPSNVTVCGQSAGAGSVAALLSMPTSAGLFRRAIAQSVPSTFFSTGLAEAVSTTIAAELGVRANAAELAGFSPHALVKATGSIIQQMPEFVESWGPMALTPTPFSPVVDGDVLPQAPWRALADGAARGIDLLVGHTRDEYRLMNTRRNDEITDQDVDATLERLAPASNYRVAYPEYTSAQLYELVNADWLFRMPSLHLADAEHAGGGRVWNYELCWSFNRDEGASHCLDFLLVFGTLSLDDIRNHPSRHPDATDEYLGLSRQMRTEWVDFATTGDPGWTPYDLDTRPTRVYAADPITQPYPEERSRGLWHQHQFDTMDLRRTT